MIIAPEDNSTKDQVVDTEAVVRLVESDPPPSYSATEVQRTLPGNAAASTSQPSTSSFPMPPDLKPPCNYVTLSRGNNSVKGAWLIDPAMVIPETFLPPLAHNETEETRKNILLESKNGSVDADVFVISPNPADMKGRKKVLVHAGSRNGSITLRVHEGPASTFPRLPRFITVQAANGSISVQLPRSFRGPLRLKTVNGTVKFSDPIQANSTQFSDLGGVRRSFLGHFNPSEFTAGQGWDGDELWIDGVNGSIKLSYDDENCGSGHSKAKSAGFFEKLFSF